MDLAPIIGTLAGGLFAIGLSIYFWVAAARAPHPGRVLH